MNNTYGIAVVCVPSDRLITDENGEQFYECMTQEELERIAKEKDKDTLKTYLFNALSMLDSTISTIATSIEKGLPTQVKILFTIKDSVKGSVLNMDNEDLSVSEKIVLGGVTIGIGVVTIYFELGIIASLIISYIATWLLSNFYIKLRKTTLHLWQEAKDLANSTWQNIMSLIESDERSLEERKEDMTNKVADEILNIQEVPDEALVKGISQETYDDLISFLCQQTANAGDIHQYLECSQCIVYGLDSNHTESNTQSPTQESNATNSNSSTPTDSRDSPNSNSTPQSNSTQSTIPLCLLIKDYNTSKPLTNKQIQLTNIDSNPTNDTTETKQSKSIVSDSICARSGVSEDSLLTSDTKFVKQTCIRISESKQTYTQTTDSRGYVSFSIDSKQRGDFFRIELVNDSTYMPQAFNLAREARATNVNLNTKGVA